ncbi:phasin family protein [Bradyrhizobium sp.]|uniref:phasin family protein n=1 Tax=Bradyrhizobium sp. TaxID=376 RepID=UPI0040381077
MSTTTKLEADAAREISRSDGESCAAASTDGPAHSLADLVEQGFARVKDTHERMSHLLEEASETFNQAFMAASRSSNEFRMQMIEMMQANMRAGLDASRQLATAKSPSEFAEISAHQTRRHLETMTVQAQELSKITDKVVKSAASSIRAISEKSRLAGC